MRPRTAAAITLAALLAACGDPATPAPPGDAAGRAAPAAPEAPPEAALDDEAVLAHVLDAARRGAPLPAVLAKLPPRVSPVRVAVRAVHDHLLGVSAVPPGWDAILAALEDLARGDRTRVDRGALGPLVAAWRTWTPADRETEHALAVRYTRGLDLLRQPGAVDTAALAVAAGAGPPKAPAKSPAAAALAALRAAHAALATPGEDVPAQLDAGLRDAAQAFADLGWPGGLGPFAVAAATRAAGPDSPMSRTGALLDAAFTSYRASGDDLRAALVTYDRVSAAESSGDLQRAAALAAAAVEQVEATGARGRERSEALFRAAQLVLASGGPAVAARAHLARALEEIEWAKLDPAQRAPVQERHATALWLLGRHREAADAARDGAAAYDAHVRAPGPGEEWLRARLDEIRGQALLDGGDAARAADAFRLAAERHAKLPNGGQAAAAAQLREAEALGRCGSREAAVLLVREVLAGPQRTLLVRSQGASVLRQVRALDEAERVLSDVLGDAPLELRDVLSDEIARLAAARGRWQQSREMFAAAARRLARASPGADTARVLADWAAMESDAGDFEEAARLADRAIDQWAATSYTAELDRAQRLFADAHRRMGSFGDAERVTALRVRAGVDPGAPLDLALIRMERAATGGAKERAALEEAVRGAAASGGLAAAAIAKIALGRDDADWAALGTVTARSDREMRLVHAVNRMDAAASALMSFARAAPPEEPEIRHWALRRVAARPESERAGVDWAEWLDLWAGAGGATSAALRAALGAGGRFVGFQWTGESTVVVFATAEAVGSAVEPGHLGFRDAWAAIDVDPAEPNAAAALRKLTRSTYPAFGAVRAADGPVVLCVGEPYGPIPDEMIRSAEPERADPWVSHGDFHVRSPSELIAAAALPAPASPAILRTARAPLAARHGVAPVRPVDDATRVRFATLVDEGRKRGLPFGNAVAEAKSRLRAEWKPDPARPALPPWMSFVLRGVP